MPHEGNIPSVGIFDRQVPTITVELEDEVETLVAVKAIGNHGHNSVVSPYFSPQRIRTVDGYLFDR